jgi:23S rRNA pseudouridine2457 synthase
MSSRYFVLNKPYGYLSQFSQEVPTHKTLADLGTFPPDVYPVGRLDQDSEGLLLLSNDKKLTDALLNPRRAHWRTYWAQVEGIPNEQALDILRKGVAIRIDKKKYQCLPARAKVLISEKYPEERDPPVRFRANIPTTWIELQLCEGKNRQVRRMCAAIGFPVLRLIRVAIEDLKLSNFVETVTEIDHQELYAKLKLG